MTGEMKAALAAMASAQGRSTSQQIRWILEKAVTTWQEQTIAEVVKQ